MGRRENARSALVTLMFGAMAGELCLLLQVGTQLGRSSLTIPGAALVRGHAPARSARSAGRMCPSHTRRAARNWLQVEASPPQEPSADSLVLPILPMSTIPWPGHIVMLKIVDPSHVQIYHDILEKGSRRIAVPFCKTQKDGRVHMDELAEEDRRVHACGALLYLTRLRDVEEITNGEYKYVAEHEVRGRVRINRVLNPAVLFQSDADALHETDFLRGEVDILEDEDTDDVLDDGFGQLEAWSEIEQSWLELNELSAVMKEPRLEEDGSIKGAGKSSWKAAALWERLMRKLKTHREHSAAYGEAHEWVREQQRTGQLPDKLPSRLNACKLGIPPSLLEKLRRAEYEKPETRTEYWQPFLDILAAEDVARRGQLLRRMVTAETRATRTHAQLHRLLDSVTE